MKKKFLILIATIMLLILSACGSHMADKKSNRETSKNKIESIFYDDLSAKDKKNIKFKFQESQDETQDNTADPVYVVSMKVTNKTNKIVKFDKSKFLIFVTEQVKFKSSVTGTLSVKPGKSVAVHQLFENVAEQALVGGGSEFIYLNKNNKLSDADFTDKGKSSQDSNNNDQSDQQSQTNGSAAQSNDDNTSETNDTNNTSNKDDGNHVATGDAYDDDNPTAGWDESNLDPSHDGKRLDRILAWTEHYKQVGIEQGMSDEDAQSYGQNIAYDKENAYEERFR